MSRIFLQLLKHELHTFRYVFFAKFIDTSVMVGTNLIVFGYFMPRMGLASDYGTFVFVGAIASFGFFDVVVRATDVIADILGERTISQKLIIPIPSWLSLCAIPVGWAISSTLLSLAIIPVGKLIFPLQLTFPNASYLQFIPIFILANLFFGFFGLWIASVITRMDRIGVIWCRIITPLWMFGGYFFTWHILYGISPYIGYAAFLDPFIFIMEGVRAALFGQEGFLPYWVSLLTLSAYVIFFAFDGIRRLKKRLDCV